MTRYILDIMICQCMVYAINHDTPHQQIEVLLSWYTIIRFWIYYTPSGFLPHTISYVTYDIVCPDVRCRISGVGCRKPSRVRTDSQNAPEGSSKHYLFAKPSLKALHFAKSLAGGTVYNEHVRAHIWNSEQLYELSSYWYILVYTML